MENQISFFTQRLQQLNLSLLEPSADLPYDVILRYVDERPTALLLHYDIITAQHTHPVLVKMRRHDRKRFDDASRPLRFNMDAHEKFALEVQALQAIEQHFRTLDDPRFGYIKVLDVLDEREAFIMTEHKAPDLRQIFRRHNRLQTLTGSKSIVPFFGHVGAWLRHFHQLPRADHVVALYDQRSDYIDGVQQLTVFLGDTLSQQSDFEALTQALHHHADAHLDDTLPTGRAHTDFAMRNILVSDTNQITVIDTLAKWHTAIYEDIGYFLARLRINQLQVFSQGLAYSEKALAQYRHAFLTAYFDNPIPEKSIYLYEVLALLDKWCSVVDVRESQRRLSFKQVLRLQLTNAYYWRLLRYYLKQLDA